MLLSPNGVMGGAGEDRVRYNKQEGVGVEGSKECLFPHACLGDSKPLSRVSQGVEWSQEWGTNLERKQECMGTEGLNTETSLRGCWGGRWVGEVLAT